MAASPVGGRSHGTKRLLADTQPADNADVPLRFDPFEIVQETTSLTNHFQQASPAGEIFLVNTHVFGQLVDSGCQDRNLDLRRSRILIAAFEIPDQIRFSLFRQCNCGSRWHR